MVSLFFKNKVFESIGFILIITGVYCFFVLLSSQISSATDFPKLISLQSGFALATIMMFSKVRTLIAIALGEGILSVYYAVKADQSELALFSDFLLPIMTVLVQTIVGLKVYRQWVSTNNQLSLDTELIKLISFVPVIALINTLLSSTLVDLVQADTEQISFLNSLVTWSGETIGLLLILSLTLSIVNPRARLWKRRRSTLLTNFIVVLLITYCASSTFSSLSEEKLKDRFVILTNQTATLFQVSLNEKTVLQNSTAGLLVASEYVTRDEFSSFVRGITRDNKYIQVVEWLPKITRNERDIYEQEQRHHFGEGFSIKQVLPKGIIIEATERDAYFPITYLEPEWDNDAAQGFDPSASTEAKALMNKAILTGNSQARDPLKIIRNSGFKNSFIVYKAVYQQDNGKKTLNPTNAHVIGFVNIVIRVDDFIEMVLEDESSANFNLQWLDVETGNYYFSKQNLASAPFQHEVFIHNSGRDMKLIFTPTESFLNDNDTEATAIIIISCFFISSLFSILVLNITARTLRIQSEVRIRTRQLKTVNDQLQLLSNKDSLTNLYNRRYFELALQKELERSKRYKAKFSLIIFDIDHFKKVNDTFGHPAGDKVLMSVGEYLNEFGRETDIVARIGGEEFAIILLDQTEDKVRDIIEGIRLAFSDIKVNYQGYTIRFTCSFGVTMIDKDVDNISEVIKQADDAMYQAKSNGRNRIQLYSK